MTTDEKKHQIKLLALEMLDGAKLAMETKIVRAINSGAIDIDGWDEEKNAYILPKIILIALLEKQADQYKATGTSFEKQVKKEVKNLKLFL